LRIHPAVIREHQQQVTVEYRFECSSRPELDSVLWFRVHAGYRGWLSPAPEVGIAALLFLAMKLGEDIEVEQPISPRFHYGVGQFIEFFHLWFPGRLKRIEVRSPGLRVPEPADAEAVVSCFSGGVDSFHTLFDHLGERAPNAAYRASHLLFVHGFDIPLEDGVYESLLSEYRVLAKALGVEVVGMATNVRESLDPHVSWVTTHGAAIGACALLLSGGAPHFIVPSTNRHSRLFSPCGSNPVTDPALGSERLEIVHHGSHRSRIGKICDIARRPEVQQHLRVCWQNVPGRHNCGRCVKCLKVMMPLALEGVLGDFALFPPLPAWEQVDAKCFEPLDVAALTRERTYLDELHALAESNGERETAALLDRIRAKSAASGSPAASLRERLKEIIGRR